MFKIQAMPTMSVAIAMTLLLISQCAAANVERQRRVQTTATTTSSAGIAGELARLGLPLRHATYETNDEFYETSSKSLTKPQPEPLTVAVPVTQESEFKVFDLLSGGELTVGQVNQLLQLNAQAEPAQQLSLLPLGQAQDEARVLFGWRPLQPVTPVTPPGTPATPATPSTPATIPDISNVVVNNIGIAPPTPATTTTDTGTTGTRIAPQLLPLQYFQNRQVTPFGNLPYGLINANQMPLVPISLGNNAVGYVPMNLRMFRQLIDATGAASSNQFTSPYTVISSLTALPIRESEEAAINPLETAENEPEITPEAEEPAAPSTSSVAEKTTSPNRLQILGQNLRQLPVLTFAKNFRRVQLV